MNRTSVFEWHKRFKEGRKSVRGVRKSIHQSWFAKGLWLGLGILCWGFKWVQEEIPREEVSTLQLGSVAFPPGQCTSPQLHPCHRLFDHVWHQDSSSDNLPIVRTLLPVTFGYSLSPEAVIMRQLRRWKRLWRREDFQGAFEKMAGLQGYIPYPHIAAECMFVLVVLLLPGHMWGSIRVHHLWARPCFSSSVRHV